MATGTSKRTKLQRVVAVSSPKDRLVTVCVYAEWRAYPCWETTAEEPTPTDVPSSRMSSDYGVSKSLLQELDDWNEEFQQLLNPSDPASTEFPSEAAKQRWKERGRELTKRLAEELGPHVRVTYFKEVIQPGAESSEQQ